MKIKATYFATKSRIAVFCELPLRICFNGSETTTCLTHDQINDKRKMPILTEETFLEIGKLFQKNSKAEV